MIFDKTFLLLVAGVFVTSFVIGVVSGWVKGKHK
jgi:hypothetical protein